MKRCRLLSTMLVCLVAFCASNFVNAIPVEFEYPRWYEPSGDPVFEQIGLEWMRWDITNGMSISQAADIYGPDGWRLATNVEMANLLNSWNFHDVSGTENEEPFDYDENIKQASWDPATHQNLGAFENLFGLTSYYCNEDEPLELDFYGCTSHTAAFFGTDDDSDGLYNLVDLSYEHWPDNSSSLVLMDSDRYSDEFAKDTIDWENYASGVALVRDVTPVPVPSSFSLLFSVMLIFYFVRRFVKTR